MTNYLRRAQKCDHVSLQIKAAELRELWTKIYHQPLARVKLIQ